ncbi:3927_t:CDS:2, partial [Rhizophagus irregularis]
TQLAESKKSGGPPITIQYKEEIEAILNKDRPTLNPKSCIDSFEFSSRNEKKLNFHQENLVEKKQTETPYVIPKIGRRHKNKCENDDTDINFDDQSKKKSKKHGNNLGNILQYWIEQQGQQSDMMLFDILNNLSNSLNSLHTKKNQVNQVNHDDLNDLEFPQFD